MTHGFHSHVAMTPSFHSHTTTHSHHHYSSSHTHHSGHHHHHSHTKNHSGHHHNPHSGHHHNPHKKNHALDFLPINTQNNSLTNNAVDPLPVNSRKNHASEPLPINSHNPQDYQILATLHSSPTSTTYKARFLNSKTLVTIKVFKDYNKLEDVYGLTRATVLAKLCIDHPNIIGVHCSFKHQDQLWIVMPFAKVESLNCLLKSSSPHGMSEVRMACILKKTLKAMECVHAHGEVHENIDLDHVFAKKGSDVKLEIGLLNFDNEEMSGQRRPVWMTAPDSKRSNKVDIWMFGLLAMEMFYGGNIPVSDREELLRLVSVIKASDHEELLRLVSVVKEPKKSTRYNKSCNFIFGCLRPRNCGRMPSRLLGEVIAMCVDQNPLNRPAASVLLKHEFFNKA